MWAVIADDLTGAAELGAVGLRFGVRAEIVLAGGKPSGTAGLVCMDTDSRFCAPEIASARVHEAARALAAFSPRWIYKKVDSLLRGRVWEEVRAFHAAGGFRGALLLPANPSLGRTIRDGHYYVHGIPIHETEFLRDPQYPRRSPLIHELLACAETEITLRKPSEPLPEGGVVVCEAEAPDDVQLWAASRTRDWAACGGAEFFGALLAQDGIKKLTAARALSQEIPVKANGGGCELFVCGSASESSKQFVANATQRGVPVLSLPSEVLEAGELAPVRREALAALVVAAFEHHSRVVLQVGLPLATARSVAGLLAVRLVETACAVLARVRVQYIFVDGGATASELLRQLDWRRLVVLEELAPGVATLAPDGFPDLRVTMKPGSYHWPREICDEATRS